MAKGTSAAEVRYRQMVAKLRDDVEPIRSKVNLLHEICSAVGFGLDIEPFVAARGIHTLVDISTSEWPEDGKLAKSCSIYDKSAAISNASHAMRRGLARPNEPQMYHSMRRVAIGCLGEMCNYRQYVAAMYDANLYRHMPQMLHHTARVYHWGQTYSDMYGCHRGRHPDHAQFIFERLINIMAGSMQFPPDRSLCNYLCCECVPPVVRAIDLTQYNPEMGFMGREDVDPFSEPFLRLISNMLVEGLPNEVLFKLISAGIGSKVRQLPVTMSFAGMREHVFVKLQEKFEVIVETIHLPAVFHHMGLMQQSSDLIKEVGNQLVAEGKYGAAAVKYKAALSLSPWNYSAAANRSMCLVRVGKTKDALECAMLAVQLAPNWAKGWARLSSAFMAVGEEPIARQCVGIACKLQPANANEFNKVLEGSLGRRALDSGLCQSYRIRVDQNAQFVKVHEKIQVLTRRTRRHWTISIATLFEVIGTASGEPVYILQLACSEPDDGQVGFEKCEGVPSPELVINFLLRAMVHHTQSRPGSILVAYRLAYCWANVKGLGQSLGIETQFETKEDAQLSATQHGNDYLGFNMGNIGRKTYRPLMLDL